MLTVESFFPDVVLNQFRHIVDMSTTRAKGHPLVPRRNGVRTARSVLRSPLVKKTRSRRRIIRPEPGSLYDIMHDNAGESLYVVPICWTDKHARLLGTKWHELEPITTPVPDVTAHAHLEPSRAARDLTSSLNALLESPLATQRSCAIKNILSYMFPATLMRAKSSAELDLYFGDRMFRRALRVAVLWKSPECVSASFDSAVTRLAVSCDKIPGSSNSSQAISNYPILAYVNRAQLASIRECLYRVMPGPAGLQNIPVSRLQHLRSKTLMPSEVDHDSHYLGILIAMAQARFYGASQSRSSTQSSSWRSNRSGTSIDIPDSFCDVKVQLLTHNDDTQEFLVYTAIVTSAFLQRFAHPHKQPKPEDWDEEVGTGIKITYARVPIWPLLGLKERLGKALGREIAGDSVCDNPNAIELWDPLIAQEKAARPVLKRRRSTEREALAEVLNRSFEIEVEEDTLPARDNTPSLSPQKRRKMAQAIGPLEVC
ncbi:hypothetical protein GQ53DRAFT_829061 [Thozetella sp. PMI_491]|nr:hypothetical protein GQ53DRAFT_829061 [Thozetella sp. PMI_491]